MVESEKGELVLVEKVGLLLLRRETENGLELEEKNEMGESVSVATL